MSTGALLAAPALQGCLWFYAQLCFLWDLHSLHKNTVQTPSSMLFYKALTDAGNLCRYGFAVAGEFLDAGDTGDLCMEVFLLSLLSYGFSSGSSSVWCLHLFPKGPACSCSATWVTSDNQCIGQSVNQCRDRSGAGSEGQREKPPAV